MSFWDCETREKERNVPQAKTPLKSELCDKCGTKINYEKLGFQYEKVNKGISLKKIIYCKVCFF